MNRRIVIALGIGIAGSAWGVSCVDSSAGGPGDGSADFDGNVPDGATFPDVSTFPDTTAPLPDTGSDASVDATLPVDDGSTPEDAGLDANDAAILDASDGALADADDGAVVVVTADAGGTVQTLPNTLLHTTRQGHSSTLLSNGHVLICGGYYGPSNSSASCDDFDPVANTTNVGATMHFGRDGHSATVLKNGQVLFTGGSGVNDAGTFNILRPAEIYDPTSSTFTLVSNLPIEARSGPAVLIHGGANDGNVLLVGGYGDGTVDGSTASDPALDSIELFTPGATPTQGTFSLLGVHLSARRGSLTAAPIGDGGMLAAGGSYGPGGGPYTYLATADTLSPALDAVTATVNDMSFGRQGAQSLVLTDGRVLVMDGYSATGYTTKLDIYDPPTRTFTSVSLPAARGYFAVALLKSGHVMIAGGEGNSGPLADILVFDAATSTFSTAKGALSVARGLAVATTLNDGRVIISGGQSVQGVVQTVDMFTE